MEQGWVYVLVNPTLPGLVKVGRTCRLPSTRVAELSQATGVATPFILVFEQPFADCVSAERDIHEILDRSGMRVAPNREFFRGPATEIVRLVMQYSSERVCESPPDITRSSPELMQAGDQHLFGQGDTLQDVTEALRCYQLAAARGSLVAFERLGVIISQIYGATGAGRSRAMSFLKDGARRGNYYCYCEIAAAAAEEGNPSNFVKAWDLFFFYRRSTWSAEAEDGPERYPSALRRYVVSCVALGLPPRHLPELRAEADSVVQAFAKSFSREINPPAARRMMVVSLQWAKQTLVPGSFVRRHSQFFLDLLPTLSGRGWDAMA